MSFRSIIAAVALLACAIPSVAQTLIVGDALDGTTLGEATRITYTTGKQGQAALFDAPSDSIAYPAASFASDNGRITFDLKFTQSVSESHPFWCLFSDVGTAGAPPGSVILLMRPDSSLMEFGIYDGGGWNWCFSTGVDWQPDVWYSIALAYGSEGMRLEVDGRVVGSSSYQGGLANSSKKIGLEDDYVSAPPMVVDNFATYSMPVYLLSLSDFIICPVTDGLLDSTTVKYEVAEDCEVSIEALDSQGAVVANLLSGQNVTAGTHTMTWDGGGLPNGQYAIRMTASPPSGTRHSSASLIIDNRWSWSKPPRMFRDYFARGIWFFWESDFAGGPHVDDVGQVQDYFEHELANLASHGFDHVMGCWTPIDHRQILLDTAQRHGIKVVIHLIEVNHWITSEQKTNIFDVAASAIQEVRDHPALLGYYIIDEPNNSPAVTARIKLAKQALEAVDPGHPSFSCLLSSYESTLREVDYNVLLVDIYPLWTSWSGDWSYYISELARGQANAGDRQFWVIPQLFGKPGAWKIPTPEEIRAELWLALAHGAKGFQSFIYQSTTWIQGEWLQGLMDMNMNPMDGRLDEMGRLNADIAKLGPTLLSLQPSPLDLPSVPVTVLLKPFVDSSGSRFAIAVNKSITTAVTFAWTDGFVLDVLTNQVLSEVVLPPGGGKLLKLLPPGKIVGRVVSTAGAAIHGVTIVAQPGGYSAETDAGGYYELPGVPEGTYSLVASRAGYAQAEATVQVGASPVTQDFVLQSVGTSPRVGLATTGLLMRVWGRVVEVLPDGLGFRVDDGSGPMLIDLSRLRVRPDPVPPAGRYVGVTGISSKAREGDSIVSVIVPRGDEDITVLE